MESLSSRCLCQYSGCSQIQPCEAGSVFQQPPATGAFTGFLKFMLCLDTALAPKEEQNHLRSPGGAPQPSLICFPKSSFEFCMGMAKSWILKHSPNTNALKLPQQSPAGEMDTQAQRKMISTFWLLDVPSRGKALDRPHNILAISSGNPPIEKGTPGHLIPAQLLPQIISPG